MRSHIGLKRKPVLHRAAWRRMINRLAGESGQPILCNYFSYFVPPTQRSYVYIDDAVAFCVPA